MTEVIGLKNKSPYHWIIVAICCALAASSIGLCMNSLGVFFVPVSTGIGIGRGTYALHATISNLMNGLFCPISIRLFRKYRFKVLISGGILLSGVSVMLMSVGDNVWLFYLLAALRGIGISFFTSPSITMIIGNWFREKHGFATGLALSFSGLSGAVFSPMFASFIGALGWRLSYVIMGGLVILLALPGTLLFLHLYPEQKGLLPYGGLAHNQEAVNQRVDKGIEKKKTFSPSVTFIAMALFALTFTAISGIAQHFPGYAQSLGFSATIGATMMSAAMIGNIVFKLVIGTISDRIGPMNASKIMIGINAISLLLLSAMRPAQSTPLVLLIAFMYGTVYSVGAVGIALISREIFGIDQYASVYPYIYLFSSVGSALSLTTIGYLYDFFGTYHVCLIGGFSVGCLDLALLFFMERRKRRATSIARKLKVI